MGLLHRVHRHLSKAKIILNTIFSSHKSETYHSQSQQINAMIILTNECNSPCHIRREDEPRKRSSLLVDYSRAKAAIPGEVVQSKVCQTSSHVMPLEYIEVPCERVNTSDEEVPVRFCVRRSSMSRAHSIRNLLTDEISTSRRMSWCSFASEPEPSTERPEAVRTNSCPLLSSDSSTTSEETPAKPTKPRRVAKRCMSQKESTMEVLFNRSDLSTSIHNNCSGFATKSRIRRYSACMHREHSFITRTSL